MPGQYKSKDSPEFKSSPNKRSVVKLTEDNSTPEYKDKDKLNRIIEGKKAEYLRESSGFFALFKGMGDEGRKRARDYQIELTVSPEKIVEKVFLDITQRGGGFSKNVLEGTNFRLFLAEGLCNYLNISDEQLDLRMEKMPYNSLFETEIERELRSRIELLAEKIKIEPKLERSNSYDGPEL